MVTAKFRRGLAAALSAGLIAAMSLPTASALELGEPMPNVVLPLLEQGRAGSAVTWRDYRGKLVYVDVWASWCGPCRQAMPRLNEIRNEFGPRGFEVVAVNVDDKLEDALRFLSKYPVDYPVLLDPKGKLPTAFEIEGMPTSYLIDPNGVVLYQHTGFKKSDVEKIRTLIEAHLPR
ncbi:MAG: TlpA disulfide reductase family protein [Pseudomonadota bacterium]